MNATATQHGFFTLCVHTDQTGGGGIGGGGYGGGGCVHSDQVWRLLAGTVGGTMVGAYLVARDRTYTLF